MMTRFLRFGSFLCALALILGGLPCAVHAQDGAPGGERYTNTALGVAFDLPTGWQVSADSGSLMAAAPDDLAQVTAGGTPAGLAVHMVFGTFNQLGITDATQLPDLLARLVPSTTAAPTPERIEWGSASGYQSLVTLADQGMTTSVALLAVAGGRVAIVRGLAPTDVWTASAGAQFDALTASLTFSLPARDADLVHTITSNDGGVLWQYVDTPPQSGRAVTAGGITYDSFDVMYMAVGTGGVLALDMSTGQPISYMGPWYSGNFVDIAIGPDTKLYLANVADDTDQAIMVVDRAGNWARAWGTRGDGDGEFAPGMPQTLAVTAAGDVWTVSEGHSSGMRNRLYKFDGYGNLLLTIDLATINPDLSGVRLAINDATEALYLVGATGALNVADAAGSPLVVNLGEEILYDQTPLDIAIAPDNNLVLALPAPGLDGFGFLEISVAGKLLDAFGYAYDTARGGAFLPGEYLRPAGLIVGPDGTIYWTETNPDSIYTQVERFTFTGDGLLPLGSEMAAGVSQSDALVGSSDPAHGGGSLSYGQTVRGALNNRYPTHSWTFEGQIGDHVVISMVDASGAGLIDPKLELKNSDGRVIAANDDVGDVHPDGMSARDARIDFFLPSSGVFTIEAGRFGGRGDYTLSLERAQG